MKTTYITFTREMAIAYREKRKQMTRRVSKFQPPSDARNVSFQFSRRNNRWECHFEDSKGRRGGVGFKCPYGHPGDQLILGTTWAVPKEFDHLKPSMLPEFEGNGLNLRGPIRIWSYFEDDEKPEGFGKLRPGRFLPGFLRDRMPRETLKVVRAEQVQDITYEEAILEGIFETPREPGFDCWSTHGMRDYYPTPRDAFKVLWDSINANRGYPWDSNPWVWVLEW